MGWAAFERPRGASGAPIRRSPGTLRDGPCLSRLPVRFERQATAAVPGVTPLETMSFGEGCWYRILSKESRDIARDSD